MRRSGCLDQTKIIRSFESAKSDPFVGAVARIFEQGRSACGGDGELVAAVIYEQLEGEYDILSWIPLDRNRRRSRGYDQAELLARDVGRRLQRDVTPVVRKKLGIRPQSQTGEPEKRKANIAGAYKVLDPAQIAGKRILLIDDIVTTGSTLSECAKTLLLAGAEDVRCATLASTR